MATFALTFRMLPAIFAFLSLSSAAEINTVHQWKYIDYLWRSDSDRQNAIDSGEYDYTKIIPTDFQKISGDRVLVATPRYYQNPASLSKVSQKTGDGGPLLEPYPSWDWHRRGNCRDSIISVNKLFLDEYNKLWLVDSGKVGNEQICSAKVIVFDTDTDEVVNRFDIPDDLSHNSKNSSMGRLEIAYVKRGEDNQTRVFIADPEGYGLVISDGPQIWRLENDDVFAPDSNATTFTLDGESVTLELGISSFAFAPPGFLYEDFMFVKPLASVTDYAIKLKDLYKSKSAEVEVTYYKGNITLPSQTLTTVATKSGIVFGGLASSPAIACYNFQNPLATSYVATPVEDDEALQFTAGAKIVEGFGDQGDTTKEEYWMLTNRLPKFVLQTMNFTDINFRIMKANVAELIDGTVCDVAPHSVTDIEAKYFFEFAKESSVVKTFSLTP